MYVNLANGDAALNAAQSDADLATRMMSAVDTKRPLAERIAPCFTPGALIATIRGEVPVEQLAPGDKVLTRDNGLREIRWIGARTLSGAQMADLGDARPVRLRAGALGNGCPQRDLIVSPHHRILVTSEIAMMLFDEREVLIAARHLTGLTGVERVACAAATYVHLVFNHHEVILADGVWTESFQPKDASLSGLDPKQRAEISAIFPELERDTGRFAPARRTPRGFEAQMLLG